MRMVSFAAWQVTNYIGGAFGEKQRSFLDHLESLGLMTEEDREMQRNIKKLQQQQDKELAKQAHATADKIVAMDKARFKNNR